MAVAVEVKPQIRVVTVGHVDHGKSTLIGRLLNDTGNLPDGKVEELRRISDKRGVAFEWSFVLDALQSERDQAITIDTTRIWLRMPERDVVLIDAPGHKEFLRNMVTGASDADAALLVVDAEAGVSEQTRRHALLLELIGVRQVVVVINKMDTVAYAAARYAEVRTELVGMLERLGIVAHAFVPTCARLGENVVARAESMPWYDGPTVSQAVLALDRQKHDVDESLRIAVQGIVRRDLQRIVVGKIESGSVGVGDDIVIAPSGRHAVVRSIENWPPSAKVEARVGEAVGFTLDGPLFVDRGDVICDPIHPPTMSTHFRARLMWLGKRSLRLGDRFKLRVGTRQANVEVETFERVIDIESLERNDVEQASTNDVVEVIFRSRELLALDEVKAHPSLGRFILVDGLDIVAGGTVLDAFAESIASDNVVPVDHLLSSEARALRNGHRGAVVWLTGLPASGKSTIAMHVEQRLFERGFHTYVLDGDNVRTGLCRDLGFAAEDRRENIRRVGEVGALFANAGMITIVAFISPYRADRDDARRAAGEAFHEVYVKADAAICEERDPKGHYKKARAGEISEFTGITGEYEAPMHAELTIDTGVLSLPDSVALLLEYVSKSIAVERAAGRRPSV
jgi:bifunctional enzyme CysN/CysC